MRIRIREGRAVAGVGGPGEVVEVPEEQAQELLAMGYADPEQDWLRWFPPPVPEGEAAAQTSIPAESPSGSEPPQEEEKKEELEDAQPRKRGRAKVFGL